MVIEDEDIVLVVDPMLGPKGSQSPFTLFRYPPKQNPTARLPENMLTLLDRVNHCIITHRHPDHIDRHGQKWLIDRNIPVLCSTHDHELFRGRGLYVTHAVDYGQEEPYLGGTAIGIEARHGYGFISKFMGKVMGFMLRLPGCPSIYLSSDTIYTEAVEEALTQYKPDICVMAAGMARLDIGEPLLMDMDDMVRFVRDAPGIVIANHMEALNHCPVTRRQLTYRLGQEGLLKKVWIPEDGEHRIFEVQKAN